MLKPHHHPLIILSICFSSHAIADCSSNQVIGTAISTALSGNTICTTGSQEEHHSNGELWDYKTGDTNHATDPRKQIGEWSVSGDNVVYNYDDGHKTSSFSFTLFSNGGNSYSFCDNSSEVASATIVDGSLGFSGC